MINQRALAAVRSSTFIPGFCKPLYESYSFARIPGTVKRLLTGKNERALPTDTTPGADAPYDAVILLFIDGFGWYFFEKYGDKFPFLKRFLQEGCASKILSQFPSTTAPHVTCVNTGLSVGQSGVYEWFYYEPKLDAMIAPLLFSFAGDKTPGSLKKTAIRPEELYPTRTIYQDLRDEGIESFVLQQETIAHSPYSKVMFHGAHQISYHDLSGAVRSLSDLIKKDGLPRSYFYLYFGEIDSVGHRHGIDSPEFEAAVEECWTVLENELWKHIQGSKKKIACLVVADHGMIPVDPKNTFYLNEKIPASTKWMKKNREGKLLVPAGSCRDFFLHIQEQDIEEAESTLREQLNGYAAVFPTQELIDHHFFGEDLPSERFLQKVGNMVILPYEHNSVWWHEKGRFSQHFYGAHGGLTRQEMETIFLFRTLS